MPLCPNCQNEIKLTEDDFGMLPCPSCSVMIFADMDGQVQVYDEEEPGPGELEEASLDELQAAEATAHPISDTASEELSPAEFSLDEYGEGATEELSAEDMQPIAGNELADNPVEMSDEFSLGLDESGAEGDGSEGFGEDFSEPAPPIETTDTAGEGDPLSAESDYLTEEMVGDEAAMENSVLGDAEAPMETASFEEASEYQAVEGGEEEGELDDSGEGDSEAEYADFDFDKPLVEEPAEEYEEPSDPLAEIEAFGNEEMQNVGPLFYDVKIEGIDTAEMRSWIREALDDERFVWNVDEVIQAIDGGELNFQDLNPVKASVIINRLKTLKVKITWRQSALQAID